MRRLKVILLSVMFVALLYQARHIDGFFFRSSLAPLHALFVPPKDGRIQLGMIFGVSVVHVFVYSAIIFLISFLGKTSWRDFGFRHLNPRPLLEGAAIGGVAICIVFLGLALSGATHFTWTTIPPVTALAYLLGWGVAMLLLACAEELAYRAVPILLVARAFPPWVALLICAAFFTYEHTDNFGENSLGLAQIALFAVVLGLNVLRTHSIAWAIGFHAAWNWTMQSALGGVGSGYRYVGHPFDLTLSGPDWLTGGSAGMEGSIFSLIVMAVLALVEGTRWSLCVRNTLQPRHAPDLEHHGHRLARRTRP